MALRLYRWSPWQGLFDIQRDMDTMMRRVFGEPLLSGSLLGTGTTRSTWVPAVDVLTRDRDLVVRAELPGIDPEHDVEIAVQDNVLTIKGERNRETEQRDGNGALRVETAYGSFERNVMLPDGVNEDDIEATYENGILEVVVRGAVQIPPTPKRIPIQVGTSRRELSATADATT